MCASIRSRPWAFALVYLALSLAVEIFLIAAVGLRIPEDNRLIAPAVLTLPPLAAAWIAGYPWPGAFLAVTALAASLTLVLTLTAGRITGISTGLSEPVVVRFLAGFLAAGIANILSTRRGTRAQG